MNKYIALALSTLLLLTMGCAKSAMVAQSRPNSYYQGLAMEADASAGNSLFSSDKVILSDEDVRKILAFKFKLHDLNRIAILPMGQIHWHGWSDEVEKAGEAIQNTLIDKLRKAPSVFDASYLPTLLVPEKKTIGHLREAAARYQADLLLIYKASFRTYEKYKLFSSDKSKAYCNLEAVLLDTRTGIVPFTILVSRTFTAEETNSDMSFYETIWKAQFSAFESALTEVGDEVVNFLSKTRK